MTDNERTERERVARCDLCEGTGYDGSDFVGMFYCHACNGTGAVKEYLTPELSKIACQLDLDELRSWAEDGCPEGVSGMPQQVLAAATALRSQGQDERAGWQPIETAPKDRSVIWAVLRPDIYPTIEPDRRDLDRWNGLHLPLRHPGVEPDGFDMGWGVAAPVGQGGFPDAWIAGWQPLPTPPDAIEAGQHKEAGRG